MCNFRNSIFRHLLRNLSGALAIVFLICKPASAAEPLLDHDYMKLPLPGTGSDILDTLYRGSIADALFIRVKHIRFPNQPIEHVVRDKINDSGTTSEALTKEILSDLGIDANADSTKRLKNRTFKAGPHRTEQGYSVEFETTDPDGKRTTCIAFVDDERRVHAIYLRFTSTKNCSEQLIRLARWQGFLN